jgi:hypothetical protein
MKIPTNSGGHVSVDAMLAELKLQRFWGEVELVLRDGELTVIRKTETENLKSLGRTNGREYQNS